MNESDFLYRYSDASKRITAAERLTLRSNPNDRRKAPSHHDHFELNYFLDGEIFFAFEGEKIDISPGDIVFIAPRHIHRSVMKTTCRYHRKHIKFTEDIFLTLEPNGLILRNLLTKRKIIKFSQNVVKELELDKLILEVENNLKKGTPYGDLCGTVSLFYLLNRIETYFEQSDPVETVKDSVAIE